MKNGDIVRKNCFVIGPMRTREDMVRQSLLAATLRGAFDRLGRSDFDVQTPVQHERGDIVQQVIRELDRADLVVADLTGNNPSVLYELGIAHCMGLPCVHVNNPNSVAAESLAFDIRQYRYVSVDLTPAAGPQDELVAMLRSAIQEVDPPTHSDELDSSNPGDPVTSFFQAPLRDVYPASGLAMGYCRNLVVRVAEAIAVLIDESSSGKSNPSIKLQAPEDESIKARLRAGELLNASSEEWGSIKWTTESLALSNADWAALQMRIWTSDDMEVVSPSYIDKLKRTGEFHAATLHDPRKKFRDMPVLFRREPAQIIDIPTTLRVIAASVSDRTGLDRKDRKKLLEREVGRFRRSVHYWIGQSVKADKYWGRVGGHTEFLKTQVVIETLPKQYEIAR